MKLFKVSIIFLFLTNSFLFTSAQQWNVYRSTNSGLPSNWCRKIKIDHSGNKWILMYGTGKLVKFDGTSWTVYDHTYWGLPDGSLFGIAIDKNDNKWIATSSGLVKYDNVNWTHYNNSNSCVPGIDIYGCSVDSSNNIWLITDSGTVRLDTNLNCTSVNQVWGDEIIVDSRNWVWVTGGSAYFIFDGSSWQTYFLGLGIPWGQFFPASLFSDSIGNVWGGAIDFGPGGSQHGIFKFDGTSYSVPYDINISYYFRGIGQVYSKNNIIAAAGDNDNALLYFDGNVWSYYDQMNSPLNLYIISDITADQFGNIWLAVEDGLYEFNPNGIIYNIHETDINKFVSYPNPVKDLLFIEFTANAQSSIHLNLYNEYGLKIDCENKIQSNGNDKYLLTIDMRKLNDGVYFYKLSTNNFDKTGKAILFKTRR